MNLWEPRTFNIGETYQWKIGPLDLTVSRSENEWLVSHSEGHDRLRWNVEEASSLEGEIVWKRWCALKEEKTLVVEPVLPDRSIVIRPESVISIPIKREAVFFVGIPIFIRLYASVKKENKNMMAELPTEILTNSWFGDPWEGELCYGLHTRARTTINGENFYPSRVICPIKVKNQSEAQLLFERLCLRTRFLNIYQGKNHLWSNLIKVNYKGGNRFSEIDYGSSAPNYDEAIQRIGQARQSPVKGLLVRTFDSIRSMTNNWT